MRLTPDPEYYRELDRVIGLARTNAYRTGRRWQINDQQEIEERMWRGRFPHLPIPEPD